MKPLRTVLLILVGIAGLSFLAWSELDDDNNFLSDVWELMYGENLDPNVDTDGDGFTNRSESGAGTNPLDPGSNTGVKLDILDDELRVRWDASFGKTYELQLCNDLASDEWLAHGVRLYSSAEHEMEIFFNEEVPLLAMGGIRHQVWNRSNIWYGAVDNLIATEQPDRDVTANAMEIPRNTGDYFVDRMFGYLIPERSGPHRFFVSGDDVTELFLSPDPDPANMTSIAMVPQWTGYNEFDKFPEQTSALIDLKANKPYYIELRHIEGSGGDHFRVFWQQPGEATGALITGTHLAPWQSNQEILELEDSHFFRIKITNNDDDGDGINNWEEQVLGLSPGTPNTPAEIAAAMAGDDAVVSLEVLSESAWESFDGAARKPAVLRAKRSGSNFPLTVNLLYSGDTTMADFEGLPTSLEFGVGQREIEFELLPANDGQTEPREDAVVSIAPGDRYVPGGISTVTCTVEDGAPELYLANLRPEGAAITAASGHSILRLAANKTYWHVDMEFNGLTSEQTAAHVHLAPPGVPGPIIHGVNGGSVNDFPWTVGPSGQFSGADILNALATGNLYINAHSMNYPDGEIRGHYRPVEGGQTIEPPDPPPAWNENDTSAPVAARFLNQATFGATETAVADLQAKGYETWIDEQVAMMPTHHVAFMEEIETQLPLTNVYNENSVQIDTELQQRHRREAFWGHAVYAPDQLRQRVAFALSQIFVISDMNDYVYNQALGTANYYDILVDHAFGDFRSLLEAVSLNPLMGNYLSSFRNPKPDPVLGIRPDENYAREVMQLFSIGLWQLHQDGSLRLDAEGRPIPTYDQFDITGMAHVFTGWAYYNPEPDPNFWYGPRDPISPMMQYPEFHDTEEKHIIDDIVLPAGQTGEQDLAQALDVLFNHPNTGPFICRQLIQRLVTANPSRAYIYRVAEVFNDNGNGVRGDLGAVVKAILMDYEARSPQAAAADNFGHLKEPICRITHIMRLFDFTSPPTDNRITLYWTDDTIAQGPLRAPSVFNFFEPDYAPPGLLSEQGLVAPEFQITDESRVIRTANFLLPLLRGFGLEWRGDYRGYLDQTAEADILANGDVDALLDHLDIYLCNGQLSTGTRANLVGVNADLVADNVSEVERAQFLIQHLVNSPDFCVQK